MEDLTLDEPKRKRNRISLNCLSCKKRKIKCDRQIPCSSCFKGGRKCEYQQPLWTQNSGENNGHFQVQRFNINGNSNQMDPAVYLQLEALKERILELESCLNQQQQSPSSSSSSPLSLSTSSSKHPQPKETTVEELRNYSYFPDHNIFVGINPYSSAEETINFYNGYNSIHVPDIARRYNFGPFAWLSILKKDPALRQSWMHVRKKVAEHRKKLQQVDRSSQLPPSITAIASQQPFSPLNTPSGIDSKCAVNPNSDAEKEFRDKAIDRDGYNDLRLYGNIQKTSNLRGQIVKNCAKHTPELGSNKIADMNKHGLSLGLTVFEGKLNQELKLIEKISMVLPSQKVVWTLINKFFDKVYPFVPILDESSFKKEMTRILGDEAMSESRLELKVEKRLDFAYLGALLIILRLTYLSLFSNRNGVNENNLNTEDTSPKAQELKYLLSNPINITLIDLAQACLEQFEIFRKINLAVLQCAFLLRLYRMFAPEDGDGADGGDSQTYNGMLIQMAYSMGINREPTKNVDDGTNEVVDDIKTNNVQRKIWFFLVICDLIQAYKYGNPLCINEKSYDTSLPFYKPGNENIKDVELEQHVIGTFAYFEKYYHKLLAILEATLDIERQIKLSELTPLITEFEVFLHEAFGNLKLFLVPFDKNSYKYPFVKIMKCKNYINMRMFLNVIFFHLYLYYEKNGNIDFAYFYLRKVYVSIIGEFSPNLFELIADNYINFGEVADLILNPTILSMIHTSSQMNFSILLRVRATIFKMKHDANHESNMKFQLQYRKKFTTIVQLESRLRKIADFFIMAMSRLSQRYYYAWRVTKAHTFVNKHSGTDEYFAEHKELYTFLDVTEDQLVELNDMVGVSLKKYTKSKKTFGADITEEDGIEFTHPSKVGQTRIKPVTPASTSSTSENIMTNPGTSETVSDDFDWAQDLNIVDNIDIDNMWINISQMKHDVASGNNGASNVNPFNVIDNGNTLNPISPESLMSNSNANNEFALDNIDLFNTLPFERYFGTGGQP